MKSVESVKSVKSVKSGESVKLVFGTGIFYGTPANPVNPINPINPKSTTKMEDHKYPFEKLEVWRIAREFVKLIYESSAGFPKEEMFGINAQIRRSAVSVASNLAEGESRLGKKDQLRFLEIAYSSLMEAINQAILANDLGMLSSERLSEVRELSGKLSNKINALYKYRGGK